MTTSFTIFSLLYFAVSFCFVFKTSEFVSAGITLENIFDFFLGSEHTDFIVYQIKRTTLTMLFHSMLPFFYLICATGFYDGEEIFKWKRTWWLLQVLCCLLPLCAVVVIMYWKRKNWSNHPLVRTLCFFNDNRPWTEIASDINQEFRRVDKMVLHTSSVTTVIATDNWLMKITPYEVKLCHQSDCVLLLCSTDEHELSRDGPGLVQYLNIEVKSTRPAVEPFFIRCNALDFRALQDKLRRPVTILEGIKFHKSKLEQFLEVFKEAIQNNPPYIPPPQQEMEMCMGCMLVPSSVKLVKHCNNQCTNCYCRPLWCVDCMAKWFASRQEEDRPETWLSSLCTCPVCRSVFCLLDVCPVQTS